jgi:hypothetical protein
MRKTSEDKNMVTDHWDLAFLKVSNMDENDDDDQIVLMIYDSLEYVRLNHYWKKILHYMLCNEK